MKVCKLSAGESGYAYCDRLSVVYITSKEEGFAVLANTIREFLPFLKSLPAGNLLSYPAYPINSLFNDYKMMPPNVLPAWRLLVFDYNKRFFPEEPFRQLEARISELFPAKGLRDFERELLRGFDNLKLPAKYLFDYVIEAHGGKKWKFYKFLGVSTHMAAFNKLKKFSIRGNYLAVKLYIAKLGFSEEFANRFIPLWKSWLSQNCVITQNCREESINRKSISYFAK